jgi:hypothetical protein
VVDDGALHPGTRSEGCVTLKSKQDFKQLRNLLLNTKKSKIPGTSAVGWAEARSPTMLDKNANEIFEREHWF